MHVNFGAVMLKKEVCQMWKVACVGSSYDFVILFSQHDVWYNETTGSQPVKYESWWLLNLHFFPIPA